MNLRISVFLLLLGLTLSSCSPSSTTPPPTPTISARTPIPYPPSNTPDLSTPTAYPLQEKRGPTTTPVNAPFWMGQPSLYLQPGDLPDEVQLGNMLWLDLSSMAPKFTPPQAAIDVSLSIQDQSENYSHFDVYFYPDEQTAHQVYLSLADSEGLSHQPLPQPGIAQEAQLFKPYAAGDNVTIYFLQCHSVVILRLFPPLSEADSLQYASRLAERLAAVDCHGNTEIPLLTPAPPGFTPTPAISAPILTVITATMHLLPDPDGTNTLRAYTFADSTHGWLALGADIYATKDGGQSWKLQTLATSQVKSITFTSQKTGWIEMVNGFLLTEDRGETWKQVNILPSQLPLRMSAPQTTKINNYDSYDFCTDKNAPFAGPFFALDEQTGWAYCTSRGDTHFETSLLYRTDDGGMAWQLLGSAPHGRYGDPDLFFLDGKHGWIGAQGGLYVTQDGGTTWSDLHEVSNSEVIATKVQFLSQQTGFVINDEPDNHGGVLQRTDDAGTTWRQVYVAPQPAAWPYGPMVFFSHGTGIGGAANELSTQDNGLTWEAIGAIPMNICTHWDTSRFGAYSFIDRQDGWYVNGCGHAGQSIIFHTSNGGSTWEPLSPSSPFEDGLVGISFVNTLTGYTVTESGLLLKTVDGGVNFKPVDGLHIHTPNIYFVNADQGWENRGGLLFKTQDGGKTWSQLNLGFSVQGFTFLPNGHGWAIAGETASAENPQPARSLMKTTDAGLSWSKYDLGSIPSNWRYPMLDTIQFTDDLHGWLRADEYLFFTNDGGLSWTQLH
jgi:photosystem II stability/assembly factor-like uncharacterized protein